MCLNKKKFLRESKITLRIQEQKKKKKERGEKPKPNSQIKSFLPKSQPKTQHPTQINLDTP